MINVFKPTKHIIYFILNLFLLFLFAEGKYETFKIQIDIEENELQKLYIKDSSKIGEKNCTEWIPSLINPVLLVPQRINVETLKDLGKNFKILSPVLSLSTEFTIHLYYYLNLFDKYDMVLAKNTFQTIVNECYFGLSHTLSNYSELVEDNINLNNLKNNNKIEEKIFSFAKWDIKDSSIDTALFIGNEHENFISKKGIIGTCKVNQDGYFWGCPFNEISLNNKNAKLINEDDNGKPYKIYFSSENYQIIFPKSFKKNFDLITNNNCNEDDTDKELSCNNLFNSKYFIPIKLIDNNMKLTIEIDNIFRFNREKDDKKNKTRIIYEDVDYFMLPLIMFKNFHVQFDAKNNIISFYTTDESILELKKEEKEEEKSKDDENEPSNTGTVLIIILIIILILVLGFIIFWVYKKRKNQAEKNINKYNKFEDDENFQDLNEKRVF